MWVPRKKNNEYPFFNDFIFYTSPCASSQLQGLVTTEPTEAHMFVWSSVIIKITLWLKMGPVVHVVNEF